MKKTILLIIIFLAGTLSGKCQTSEETLSFKIAGKLKDSLSLTEAQHKKAHEINLQLHDQKLGVWKEYAGSDSLIQKQLQRVENSRDSLYQSFLTPLQYELYIKKKRTLIVAN